MARKLSAEMIQELTQGKYRKILNIVKKDADLSLEIRPKDKVKIYYQKGLILTLGRHSYSIMNLGYTKKHLSNLTLDLDNPKTYFDIAKPWIRFWKAAKEFTIQQNIMNSNHDGNSRYYIIDMEYVFPQEHLPNELRQSGTRPDLVGIDQETGGIVLFELKQGLGALKGASGVDDHFEKTNAFLADPQFCQSLKEDVVNIIEGKKALGLLKTDTVPTPGDTIQMMYIFAYNNDDERTQYETTYAEKYRKEGIETIFLDTRYKLNL